MLKYLTFFVKNELITKLNRIYIKFRWDLQMRYHIFIKRRNNFLEITDLQVVYEDPNILIVSKSHDLMINHAEPHRLFLTLSHQLYYNRYWRSDPAMFHKFRFCHQLDYSTSGLICIGYNKRGGGTVSESFQKRKAKKQYLALVWGHINQETFDKCELLTEIGGDNRYHKISIDIGKKLMKYSTGYQQIIQCTSIDEGCEQPRSADTRFALLERGFYADRPASKVLLVPYTGRTHQLRVHCRHIGHPIIGDCIYGDDYLAEKRWPRMMLHAYRLNLPASRVYSEIDVCSGDPFGTESDKLWRSTETVNRSSDFEISV